MREMKVISEDDVRAVLMNHMGGPEELTAALEELREIPPPIPCPRCGVICDPCDCEEDV